MKHRVVVSIFTAVTVILTVLFGDVHSSSDQGSKSGVFGALRNDVSMPMNPNLLFFLPEPLYGSKPFVTIFCKYPEWEVVQLPSFVGEMHEELNDYWREVSYGQMDIDGTVAKGWYTLPKSYSHYYEKDFFGLEEDCLKVADPEINFNDFFAANLLFSGNNYWPHAGCIFITLEGENKCWWFTSLPGNYIFEECRFGDCRWNLFKHEMGHTMRLYHSFVPNNPGYANGWDIMSSSRGQHPNAYHKNLLGWIPARNKIHLQPETVEDFELKQLATMPTNGYLLATIPINDGIQGHFYTVEARREVGRDIHVPDDAVIIHEVVPGDYNGLHDPAYLVDPDGDGDASDDAAKWTVGEAFVDQENNITVCINSDTVTGYRVTLASVHEYSCEFAPDFSRTIVSTMSSGPAAGEEMNILVELVNGGVTAENVIVTATIPHSTTYVTGSASTSQGSVEVDTNVRFEVGKLNNNELVNLGYAVKLDAGLSDLTTLRGSVYISWEGGSRELDLIAIVNPVAVKLPVVTR